MKNRRPIDEIAENTYSHLGKAFVLIKKTRVKTWQGVFIIALAAGIAITAIAMVSMDVQVKSKASGETATLALSPANITTANGGTFSVNIMLDTKGSSVVVTRSVITYDQTALQLQNFDLSSSVFKSSLDCGVSNKTDGTCNIVVNDAANGKLDLTVFVQSSASINTASGLVATLNFKALSNNTRKNIDLAFISAGNYADSDVILSGDSGTDILSSVTGSAVAIGTPPEVCASFTYTDWSTCQVNGTQTHQVASSLPAGCAGGSPVLSQSCTYVPPVCVTDTSIYSDWSACQSNGTQTKTRTTPMPSGCAGGELTLTQSCTYVAPTNPCTSFQYSDWSTCQSDGTQSRAVTASLPAACVGGENPILTQTCTYAQPQEKKKSSSSKKKKSSSSSARTISNSPTRVSQGAILTERGKKFSKNSTVLLYFSNSAGVYSAPVRVKTSATGAFSLTYRVNKSAGTYKWYAVDEATGKRSKTATYRVK